MAEVVAARAQGRFVGKVSRAARAAHKEVPLQRGVKPTAERSAECLSASQRSPSFLFNLLHNLIPASEPHAPSQSILQPSWRG